MTNMMIMMVTTTSRVAVAFASHQRNTISNSISARTFAPTAITSSRSHLRKTLTVVPAADRGGGGGVGGEFVDNYDDDLLSSSSSSLLKSTTTRKKTNNSKEKTKKKFYAVAVGRTTGIYHSWGECKTQVCVARLCLSVFVFLCKHEAPLDDCAVAFTPLPQSFL